MKAQPSTKQQVVSLLRNVAKQLQAMDESTLERVLAGGFRIDADLPDKRKPAVKQGACSEQQIDELRAALSKIDNHEEARRVIGDLPLLAGSAGLFRSCARHSDANEVDIR